MIFKNNDDKLKSHCKIAETDKFWDIGEITPSRKALKKSQPISTPDTVLICENDGVSLPSGNIPLKKNAEQNQELVLSYSPENSLIKTVSIYTWPLKYLFYERFKLDARKYYNIEQNEVQPVRYYSYMPSYAQMSVRQREWYFYWRKCVRQKNYLPTDSSYILLYVYEIINLPELIPADEGLELLCDIWGQYRESYTKLDKYMSEWICDYCLINNIKLPYERISSFLPDITEVSAFKQFYVYCENGREYASLLLEKGSSYRWRKGKYITDDNKQLFEKHMNAAFAYAIERFSQFDGRFDKQNRLVEKKTVRDSFGGALCAYNIKRKIELAFYDVTNTADIAFIITDTVRYCENRIRAYLGIRARLGIQNLTEQHKNIINEYFDKFLPAPFYEKKSRRVYEDSFEEEEVKPFSVSFEKAKEIERRSWEITDRLVEDDVDEEYETAAPKESKDKEISVESESLDIARQALVCVYKGNTAGFADIANESYMLPETLAECVNELCFEVLGDIGIEEKDGRYVVIPDYEQEIKQWLRL